MSNFRRESLPSAEMCRRIISAYRYGMPEETGGCKYTAYGRDKQYQDFVDRLKDVKKGCGDIRAYVGPFGVGKSFCRTLFKEAALDRNFIVMSSEVNRSSQLFIGGRNSSNHEGLNLYHSLLEGTYTKEHIKGHAFKAILNSWYEGLYDLCGGNLGLIQNTFSRVTRDLSDMFFYSDIRTVINLYFKEVHADAPHFESLEWLFANYNKNSEAKIVGAKNCIKDNNWFEVLSTLGSIFVVMGKYLAEKTDDEDYAYSGIVIMIDQLDSIIKSSPILRDNNYAMIRHNIWDVMTTKPNMMVCLLGADVLLTDKRGVSEYAPLQQVMDGAIRLESITTEDLISLIDRLKDCYKKANKIDKELVSEEEMHRFLYAILPTLPLDGNCIRPITVPWIRYLDEKSSGKDPDLEDYAKYGQKISQYDKDNKDGSLPELNQ